MRLEGIAACTWAFVKIGVGDPVLLEHLVHATARTHPYRSRQYQALLRTIQARYRQLRDVISRHCHVP